MDNQSPTEGEEGTIEVWPIQTEGRQVDPTAATANDELEAWVRSTVSPASLSRVLGSLTEETPAELSKAEDMVVSESARAVGSNVSEGSWTGLVKKER